MQLLKQKNICKHEDLTVTLFRLLGKRLVQLGESESLSGWIIHLVDVLANGRDFDVGKVGVGPDRLFARLRDDFKRMELPASWRRQVASVLPLLTLNPTTFDLVISSGRPAGVPPCSECSVADSREIHLDPWRLLEDYPDTPFNPSVRTFLVDFSDTCQH